MDAVRGRGLGKRNKSNWGTGHPGQVLWRECCPSVSHTGLKWPPLWPLSPVVIGCGPSRKGMTLGQGTLCSWARHLKELMWHLPAQAVQSVIPQRGNSSKGEWWTRLGGASPQSESPRRLVPSPASLQDSSWSSELTREWVVTEGLRSVCLLRHHMYRILQYGSPTFISVWCPTSPKRFAYSLLKNKLPGFLLQGERAWFWVVLQREINVGF